MKAEAVSKAKQFSQELKAELRRFSWSRNGSETALEARDLRKQRAQYDRNRSGAKKALHGLKFISSKSNGVDAWNEMQSNFDRFAKDGSFNHFSANFVSVSSILHVACAVSPSISFLMHLIRN
jgi:respiratory burst oxidase